MLTTTNRKGRGELGRTRYPSLQHARTHLKRVAYEMEKTNHICGGETLLTRFYKPGVHLSKRGNRLLA